MSRRRIKTNELNLNKQILWDLVYSGYDAEYMLKTWIKRQNTARGVRITVEGLVKMASYISEMRIKYSTITYNWRGDGAFVLSKDGAWKNYDESHISLVKIERVLTNLILSKNLIEIYCQYLDAIKLSGNIKNKNARINNCKLIMENYLFQISNEATAVTRGLSAKASLKVFENMLENYNSFSMDEYESQKESLEFHQKELKEVEFKVLLNPFIDSENKVLGREEFSKMILENFGIEIE